MTLNLLSEPFKSDDALVVDYAVLAARSPGFWEFQRNDWFDDVLSVDETAGSTIQVFQIDNAELTDFAVGDLLYIKSIDAKGVDGFFPATDVQQPGGGGTDVFVQTEFLGLDTLGNNSQLEIFNNNTTRSNYRIVINTPGALQGVEDIILFFSPDQTGFARLDLSEANLHLARLDGRQHTGQMIYSEVFEDSGILGGTFLSTFMWINGIKTQQDRSGFDRNLASASNYINYGLYSGRGRALSKMITGEKFFYFYIREDQVAPFRYRFFEYGLTLIVDPDFDTREGAASTWVVEILDVNKDLIDTTPTQFITNQDGLEIVISEQLLQVLWTDFVKYIRVVTRDEGATTLTQPIEFEVINLTGCNKVLFVQWQNELGGLEQNAFVFNQDFEQVADVGVVVKPPITQAIDAEVPYIDRIVEVDTQLITVHQDRLTNRQIKAFHSMKSSPNVVVFSNPQIYTGTFESPGVKVIVEDTYSTNLRTRSVLNSFSCKLRFPDNFDLEDFLTYVNIPDPI